MSHKGLFGAGGQSLGSSLGLSHGWFDQLVPKPWMNVCAAGDVRSLCGSLLIRIVESGSVVKILKK